MPRYEHIDQLFRWIQQEGEAEAERLAMRRRRVRGADAERTGETLLDMAISDHQPGLGGRYLLTLVKRNRTLSLPWNRLRVGSPVVLTAVDVEDDACQFGVVSGRTSQGLQVAVADFPAGERFRVDLSPDEVTRQRQRTALRAVIEAQGRLAVLRDILLGERLPRFGRRGAECEATALNPSQHLAIQRALSAEDLAVIHGPPGTGKTTTVVELMGILVAAGEKVLACAPSNTAVDNLLGRLIARGVRAVRIGHPARVEAGLREHSLDYLVENHENMQWVRELMRGAEQLYRQANRYTRAKPAAGQKQQLRRDARRLKSDARELEQQAVEHILDSAQVICATTTCDADILGHRSFDTVVIDEACQSTEPGCWIPLLYAQRLILAGDHCQLPPTVLSSQAAREGFNCSLMERLVAHYGADITARLDQQYRMHQHIMQFSSDQFYEGALSADSSVAHHVLADLPHVTPNPLTTVPITFVDTAGAGWDEEQEPDGESRRNPREGAFVLRKVRQLIDAGLAAADIAVITPYAAQVRWLRQESGDDNLEIDTVDGFQGREKEAVIISLVRANATGEIGFLADTRRMNVALTRARRKLIVIGDSATLAHHPFYAQLLDYFENVGAYHSVWEEDTQLDELS